MFETTDLPTIRQVHTTVMSNKIFRRIYKNKLNRMEVLIVQYHRFLKNQTKTEKEESEKMINRHIFDQQVEREKFNHWMQNSGMSIATARCYVSALNSFSIYLSNKAGKRVSIYEESDEFLHELKELLVNDPEVKSLNIKFHNQIGAAINKFIFYRSGEEPQLFLHKEKPENESSNDESIPKIEYSALTESGTDCGSDPEMERFDKILKDNFSEGLLLNALRLDKFRMFYEAEFGYELTPDDEDLVEQLKRAGIFMDERIYPKQDERQSNLTAEILNEIINAMNNGARCIYLECVLARWRTELAEQLNIYNTESLKALFVNQNIEGLVVTNDVLKATTKKVYPEENIIEVMRSNHSFLNYEQLAEKLWFLPIEVMKHTLVTTSSIVNVDAETYFYAPNFPASVEELQQIRLHMTKKLEEKGYLVAPDIYSIIHDHCQTVAMNTVGYKDWAYRNIFKFLFREDFEFGSSVISKKGNALEMREVYKGYCQEHERITLDDFQQLKDELGVTIYWDIIREEMIRINMEDFIRKDLVPFDIDAIDEILDEMCPSDYLPLKDITMFLHFPSIGYPWNRFVVESYLPLSKKFCLFHASYANHGAFGVMVRKNSKLSDYKSVVIDMLSHNEEWKTKEQALTMIVDKGYQARKRWSGFEKIIQEANLLREKLLEEGK